MSEHQFYVGQRVKATDYLGDAPSGDSPGGCYASKGEELIVRAIKLDSFFPISVSHEHITDRTFGVKLSEIEPA